MESRLILFLLGFYFFHSCLAAQQLTEMNPNKDGLKAYDEILSLLREPNLAPGTLLEIRNIVDRYVGMDADELAGDNHGEELVSNDIDADDDNQESNVKVPTGWSSCEHRPCSHLVSCNNNNETFPGYVCGPCPLGMSGNGLTCTDIDECEYTPCSHMTTCVNHSPGYICTECPSGYRGSQMYGNGIEHALNEKQVCQDINECDIDTDSCKDKLLCNNIPGGYFCGPCLDGFSQNKFGLCQPVGSSCSNNDTCSEHALCVEEIDPRLGLITSCQCRHGYAGDGLVCGVDSDFDGFPDDHVACQNDHCIKDNCQKIPNSGQEDTDKDQAGNRCDKDDDNDGIYDLIDNCPLRPNKFQTDTDHDQIGDACDNCRLKHNVNQSDVDGDTFGDACDNDADNDSYRNENDNCPYVSNSDQHDTDEDGWGDACDNCPEVSNPDQSDADENGYGDACDDNIDTDADGIPDNFDNCPFLANAAQLDNDDDGRGNACDDDDDDDGFADRDDNCPLMHNLLQFDIDSNGRGDVCEHDYDDDGVDSRIDSCPLNSKISSTDFRDSDVVHIGRYKRNSKFQVFDNGRDVYFRGRSMVSMLIGKPVYEGFDFTGVMYVNQRFDDDMIGLVFGYQKPGRFYVVTWKRRTQYFWLTGRGGKKVLGRSGLELKLVNSVSGRSSELRDALWSSFDYPGQTKLVWKGNMIGWKLKHAYHFSIQHRPMSGHIRIKVVSSNRDLVIDSGIIKDSSLLGGRIGLYTFSQNRVVWSNLNIECNDNPFITVNATVNRINT